MRFLSMIRVNERSGQRPSEKLMADMGKLIEEMTKEGTLVTTAGLRPTSEGFRVRLSGGKLRVTDGPFTEAKEVIGGYAMLEEICARTGARPVQHIGKVLVLFRESPATS